MAEAWPPGQQVERRVQRVADAKGSVLVVGGNRLEDLGDVLLGRRSQVDREMALALELDADSPVVLTRQAVTALMPRGHLEEAAEHLERAIDVDPLAVWPRMWLASMAWLGRQYDRAFEQARLVFDIAPGYFFALFGYGNVLREAGRFDEAIAAYHKVLELTHGAPMTLGWLGLALAESGDPTAARAVLSRLHNVPPGVHVPESSFAWIHLGLGETDEFFTWMHRAIDARDHMIMPIKSYPFMDGIRGDARYAELLRKMNLS